VVKESKLGEYFSISAMAIKKTLSERDKKKLLKLKSNIEKAQETLRGAGLHKEMMRLLGKVQKVLTEEK